MKLNNKGFLITGILYSLLLLFLILVIGMIAILSARQNKVDYISRDIITRLNDKYNFNVARTWEFDYTGNYQVFTVPTDGYYQVELWGASGTKNGSTTPNTEGRGAYTKGTIYLTKGENIYIYIGGMVSTGCRSNGYCDTEGGYNGGGPGESAGGGATDIRLTAGNWNDFNSLKSRIMVAAGGGGGAYQNVSAGPQRGDGGTLYGIDAKFSAYSGHGATQISGGKPGSFFSVIEPVETENMTGKFGMGGYGIDARGLYTYTSSGGGGGYYGGGHGNHPGNSWSGAGGGSSFISGLYGCDAIAEASTENAIVHTGQPNHYSGKIFYNGIMIAGDSNMPTHDGTSTMTGNTGNGYAKISLLSTPPQSYTITNLVIDGSFENDGWNGIVDSTHVKYGTKALKIDSAGWAENTVSSKNVMLLNNEHIYYGRFEAYSLLSGVSGGIYWPIAEPSFNDGISLGEPNKWNIASTINNRSQFSSGNYSYRVDFNNYYKDTSVWYDGVMMIDLTESFGVGNEPSKEWCDENISYFDGTTTIYK